jgi:hypothetical protein
LQVDERGQRATLPGGTVMTGRHYFKIVIPWDDVTLNLEYSKQFRAEHASNKRGEYLRDHGLMAGDHLYL